MMQPRCAACGSTDIWVDAKAVWVNERGWVLEGIFSTVEEGGSTYCENCADSTDIDWAEIS